MSFTSGISTSNPVLSIPILGALPLGYIAGAVCLHVLGWAAGVGLLAWAVGGGWGGWPRNLMDAEVFPVVWYWLFILQGSSSSAIGRSSSLSLEPAADTCGGISSKVRH